ncbi:SDR family NAD(P)-dependent oxidoreductase [Sphingomonas arantia]|uniref:SDR family NAD(P)-dependent oxidoreductase n=1 Tax=Sphingomonas arantia TaxID=1460676 RepID=A0ABW4TZV8_9SPHN
MANSIFIVGTGPGIGAATAERFAREGWTIVLGARSRTKLESAAADLQSRGYEAHAVSVDATDARQLHMAIAKADDLAGGLTAVLFNAALVRAQDLFGMSDSEIESDLAVNVAAGMHTIRAAHELFSDRGGIILVTGGGLAVAPHASYASLGAGKAALRNLVQGLAPDLATRGIRIATATIGTLVAPGSQEAADVADIFWGLATSPDAEWEATYPAAS